MTGPWIAAFVALAILNLAVLIVVFGVLRQVLPVLENATRHRHSAMMTDGDPQLGNGPEVGTLLPEFEAEADDRTVTSGQLGEGSAVLLMLDEACKSCRVLKAELHRVPLRLGDVRLYPVVDEHTVLASLPAGPGIQPLRQHNASVAAALSISMLPSAVAVRDGVVVDWQPVASVEQLQGMIESVARPASRLRQEPTPPVRSPAGAENFVRPGHAH